MRISDWSSDVCSSDLPELADVADRDSVLRIFRRWQPETVYHAAAYKHVPLVESNPIAGMRNNIFSTLHCALAAEAVGVRRFILVSRSEEHTSELQSLMRISYAVFCLKKKKIITANGISHISVRINILKV